MPSSQAGASLPFVSYDLIGCTTFDIPHQGLALFVVQNLAIQHSLQLPVMCRHVVIVKVGSYFQTGVTNRIERKDRHIKIQDIGIVPVITSKVRL